MDQTLAASVHKKITEIRLSPLRLNIHVLLEAINNDDMDVRGLSDVIGQYPVITARLLSLANSVWAAPVKPITSLENACLRLGTSVVKSISIAIAVASTFNASSCPQFDFQAYWVKCILVAECCFLLASRYPDANRLDLPKTAQTAGIMHGLGFLWLAENLPLETSSALSICGFNEPLGLNKALRDGIGTDYCEIGGWIAKQWNLPAVFCNIIQFHLETHYREEDWEVAYIVGAAIRMTLCLVDADNAEWPVDEVLLEQGISAEMQLEVLQQMHKKSEKIVAMVQQVF